MHVVYSKNEDVQANPYDGIFEQYATEAAFLWILRSIAINEPHNDKQDIAALEQRINTQLDGLMTSPEQGWQVCEQALDIVEAGEVFTAMVIAMRSHDTANIKLAVDTGLASANTMKGLVSAMGWIADDIANIWIERFLAGKDMLHKYLGVAACSVRRKDPGDALLSILKREDCMQDAQLYSRALRLVGELRRHDCMPFLNNAVDHENDDIKFWANWSIILLGQHNNVNKLKPYVLKAGGLQNKAIQIVFRTLALNEARDVISELSKDESQTRAVIKAIGVLGDPHAVNWLINKMQNPLYAKLAGEAFSSITGVDFDSNDLSIDTPEDYPVIPNDDLNDDIVGLDEDENLPYPDAAKVATIWQKYGKKFIVGKRYFYGKLISANILNDILNNGMQRQRHAAAMELALSENGMPLVNTHGKVIN